MLLGNVARVHFGNGWLKRVWPGFAAAVPVERSLSSFGPNLAFNRGTGPRKRGGFSAAAAAWHASRFASQLRSFPGGLHGVVHHQAEQVLLALQEAGGRVVALSGERPLAQHVICSDVNRLSQPAVKQRTVQREGFGETCGKDVN